MTTDALGSGPAETQFSKYNIKPYQPDGGFEIPGVMMLLSALAIAGAALGFLAHWASNYFYLIILFPLLIGFVLGTIGMRMVRQGRVRNPWMGGLAGFAGGILAMFMMHYFDYQEFKSNIATLPPHVKEIARLPLELQRASLKEGLTSQEAKEAMLVLQAANVRNMLDYMNYAAQQGVELKSTSGSSKTRGMNLGFVGSYIYWVIEVLIVAGMTYALVRSSAAEPYCAKCGKWKQAKVLGTMGGNVEALVAAAKTGDLRAVGAAKGTDPTGPLQVTAACCDGCVGDGAVDVKLELLSVDAHGKEQKKQVAHLTYPAEALPKWAALFVS